MRVPRCAMIAALLATGGCSQDVDEPPPEQQLTAALCGRAELPAGTDPASLRWELVAPPAGNADQRQVIDTIVDLCDSIATLSHGAGPGGGKSFPMGPNQLFRTPDATRWTSQELDVNGAWFRDLTQAEGVWVAVGRSTDGAGGVIAIADRPDAAQWRQVFSGDEWGFDSVAFGAGMFVATSQFGIAFSSDGQRWSWAAVPLQSPPASFHDVAFGNGRFVVAGVGAVLTSADGRSWQRSGCSAPAACDGRAPDDRAGEPQIALQQISFVGDRFYGFGASGGLESRDGRTFEPVAVTTPSAALGGVLLGAGLTPEEAWVRAAGSGELTTLFVSTDAGQSWSPQPLQRVAAADCTIDPCAVIPAGIVVARPR